MSKSSPQSISDVLARHPTRLEIVRLKYAEGQTQAQICKRLKMSQPTVSRELRLALGQLRKARNLFVDFDAD